MPNEMPINFLYARRVGTSVDADTLQLQLLPRLLDLYHQLSVRIWHVVECHDTVSEFEKEVCAEGDEGPEGELGERIC